MKFCVTSSTALAVIASVCDARMLCGDAPVETAAPTSSSTPVMTSAAPEPTTTAPPSTAPATTPAPPANFYIDSPNGDVNTYTDIPFGQCYSIGCWRSVAGYRWEILGSAGTTVNLFTGYDCLESTLGTQMKGDEAGSVPSADATTYKSFVILGNSGVPTSDSLTSTRVLCQQK